MRLRTAIWRFFFGGVARMENRSFSFIGFGSLKHDVNGQKKELVVFFFFFQ